MKLFHDKVAIEVPVKYLGAPPVHRLMNAWSKRGRVNQVQGDRTYHTEHGVMVRDVIVTLTLQHNDEPEGPAFKSALDLVKYLLDTELVVNVITNGAMTGYTKEDML